MQFLATMVALLSLQDVFNNFLNDIANSLPGVIGAIIIVIIGVIVGWFVAKIVNRVVNNTVEKNFDKSTVGKTFRESGFDLSNFVAGVVEAFIIIISITVAIGLLNIQGAAGSLLAQIAAYLPRLLGGILIIVVGVVLVDFLASLIGSIIKPMFGPAKAEIADMLKNLLFIGLVAVILNIAFDMLQFSSGSLVYSLILGFVIIGAGVILTDGLIKSITDDHQEFAAVAGYAKFVLYSIFLLIGAGAIFSTFSGVTGIISTIAWGFAIALAIILIPIVYGLAKRMQAETK
jgi:Mechanosensitive ion channel, conserved TM helix